MAAAIPENPDDEGELKRAPGSFHPISLGIGAIIGAGIFVLTSHAAAGFAGPGVVISFAIAGARFLFAGLCYSEYASIIPAAGSAYTLYLRSAGPNQRVSRRTTLRRSRLAIPIFKFFSSNATRCSNPLKTSRFSQHFQRTACKPAPDCPEPLCPFCYFFFGWCGK